MAVRGFIDRTYRLIIDHDQKFSMNKLQKSIFRQLDGNKAGSFVFNEQNGVANDVGHFVIRNM